MWHRTAFALLLASICWGPPGAGAAEEDAAWSALRAGGHVVLMRHADAPGGAGDPPGFRLDDCATQRNLSQEGRAEARAVGARLRRAGIAVGRVLSSPWCRCVETARLMEIGPVEIEPTFSNAFVLRERRNALTEGARAVVAAWKGPGTLLVVTHGANIQALTGYSPAPAELVIVAGGPGEALRRVGTIAPGR